MNGPTIVVLVLMVCVAGAILGVAWSRSRNAKSRLRFRRNGRERRKRWLFRLGLPIWLISAAYSGSLIYSQALKPRREGDYYFYAFSFMCFVMSVIVLLLFSWLCKVKPIREYGEERSQLLEGMARGSFAMS